MVKHRGARPRLEFTGGGRGLAVHAGARLLADLADATGLTGAVSEAMAPTKVRQRGCDRGRVLADAAVMVAGGGEAICDTAAVAGRPRLLVTVVADDDVDGTDIACIEALHRRRGGRGPRPGTYGTDVACIEALLRRRGGRGPRPGTHGTDIACIEALHRGRGGRGPRPGTHGTDVACIEALLRGRGRAERWISDHEATGPAELPSRSPAIDAAWLQLSMAAHGLLAWTELLAVDGDLAEAGPERLRRCLLRTAARIAHTGRRRVAELADDRPWTPALITAFERVHYLPLLI